MEPPKKTHLLVVDDNVAIQGLLSRTLSSMGYDVTVADNGIKGMAFFLARSYDLVITDIEMPQMNGWELSRIIKERSSNTPVIAITGSYDDKLWETVKMNGVNAVFIKRFKLKEIQQTVQRLLSGRP
jgi:CheY-like chemotaxis protein